MKTGKRQYLTRVRIGNIEGNHNGIKLFTLLPAASESGNRMEGTQEELLKATMQE